MIKLTLRKKIITFAISLLFLILGCSITGIWGLYQVRAVKNNALVIVKLYNNFQELRILFEQS